MAALEPSGMYFDKKNILDFYSNMIMSKYITNI